MATLQQALDAAIAYQTAGQLDQAEAIYRQILRAAPDQPDAVHLLGVIAHQRGDHRTAIESIERAIKLNPDQAAYYGNLGVVWKELGELKEAAACYRRALELQPAYPEACNNLGLVCHQLGNLVKAVDCYQEALRLRPDCPDALRNLGLAFFEQCNLAEAARCYRRAIELQPHSVAAYNGLGRVLAALGDFDEAHRCHRRAAEFDPDSLDPYFNLVHTMRVTPETRAEFEHLERMAERSDLPAERRSKLCFALGKVFDDCGEPDKAFRSYEEANRLSKVVFDADEYHRYVNSILDAFPRRLPPPERAPGRRDRLPVFIVGMPRSGTSLVEQILTSHPDVFGAGELLAPDTAASQIQTLFDRNGGYPRCVPQLDEDLACRIADAYLARLRELGGEAKRVTDKVPLHFKLLGAIALVLPDATIIHCRRHPLDTCLSCYFRDFSRGQEFSYDLGNLGRFYREYERLMDHWRAVLPRPMYEVQYEELVSDQERVSRELVEFCGLAWHPDCLRFHENTRPVQTASRWQVRQPMYATSIGRWKHYDAHLGPLKEALGCSAPEADGLSGAPPAGPPVTVEHSGAWPTEATPAPTPSPAG